MGQQLELDGLWAKALRICGGACRTTPVSDLLIEMGGNYIRADKEQTVSKLLY